MLSHVKLAAPLPSGPAGPDSIKLVTAEDFTIRQIDQLERFAERNSWRNGLDDESGHGLEPYRLFTVRAPRSPAFEGVAAHATA